MTDYVYETDGSLPDGKSDLRPLTAPAQKSFVAAEWNRALAAIKSSRAAVLAGRFLGLEHNPLAAVGTSTQALMRSRNGAFEISEGGAAFRGVSTVFNVKSYGAKGDGVTDDSAAIQAAITAALSAGGGVVYLSEGVFAVETEIALSGAVTLRGAGVGATSIFATGAIASVLAVSTSGKTRVEHLTLDGNRQATACGRASGSCSEATFDHVRFYQAARDGWHFPDTGIQDNNVFTNCVFQKHGTLYRTSGMGSMAQYTAIEVVTPGTVATASGAAVVGTGTQFTAMGIRRGDFITIGVSPLVEHLQILSVTDDTHLVLESGSSSTLTRSGQPFAIGVGDGYHETYGAADNNVNSITGGHAYSCAGTALVFGGLYGPRVRNVQIDYQRGYAVAVGNPGLNPVYGSYFDGLYIEACNAGGFYLGYALGITIQGVMDTQLGAPAYNGQVTTYPPRWRAPGTSFVNGVWIGSTSYSNPAGTAVDALGGGVSTIPVSASVGSGFRFVVAGRSALSQEIANAIAGTTLTPGTSHSALQLAGDVTMTATPTVGVTGRVAGDLCLLWNDAGGFALTVQDDSLLSGSKLKLGGKQTLVIGYQQQALLIYNSDGFWHLVGTDGTLTDKADATGSPGAATQHTRSGRVAIAAGAPSVAVTNNKVTSTSKVFAQLQTVDGTLTTIKAVVPGSGSFTITGNANATGNVNVCWRLE